MLSMKDVFRHQLGVAYDAEQQILGILDETETETGSTDLRNRIRAHRLEKQRQITNLERCFELMGGAPANVRSLTLRGLRADRMAFRQLQPVQPAIEACDLLLLELAAQTSVALYRGLCDLGRRIDAGDAVRLLSRSLESEQGFTEWLLAHRQALLAAIEPDRRPLAAAPVAAAAAPL
jgi:ferritin-like metal-binding protein YciE